MDICYVNNKVQFSGINVNRDKQCGSFDVVPGTDDERKGRSVSLLHMWLSSKASEIFRTSNFGHGWGDASPVVL